LKAEVDRSQRANQPNLIYCYSAAVGVIEVIPFIAGPTDTELTAEELHCKADR